MCCPFLRMSKGKVKKGEDRGQRRREKWSDMCTYLQVPVRFKNLKTCHLTCNTIEI